MQIQEVGPADAARIAEIAALAALTRAADAPDGQPVIEPSYAATIRHPVSGYETRNYAATADGALVGYLPLMARRTGRQPGNRNSIAPGRRRCPH